MRTPAPRACGSGRPVVGFTMSVMCVDSPAARAPGSQVGESALKPTPLVITQNWSTTNPLWTLL